MNCDLTLHNISTLRDSTGVSYTKFLQLSECPTCSPHPVQPTEVHECVRGCLGLSDLHFVITWTQIVWMLVCPVISCECADAALQGHQVQTGKQSNENNYLSVCMSTSEYNTSMMITCWQRETSDLQSRPQSSGFLALIQWDLLTQSIHSFRLAC